MTGTFCKISGYFVKFQEFSEFISGYSILKSGSTAPPSSYTHNLYTYLPTTHTREHSPTPHSYPLIPVPSPPPPPIDSTSDSRGILSINIPKFPNLVACNSQMVDQVEEDWNPFEI